MEASAWKMIPKNQVLGRFLHLLQNAHLTRKHELELRRYVQQELAEYARKELQSDSVEIPMRSAGPE